MKKILTFILVLMSLAIPSIAMAAANNVITYTSTTGMTVAVEPLGWGRSEERRVGKECR